jgi:hypothetical protein
MPLDYNSRMTIGAFMLLAPAPFLLMAAAALLVASAAGSMLLGLSLAVPRRTRWITPIFTLILPLPVLGATAAGMYLPPLMNNAALDVPLALLFGAGVGLATGCGLAALSWMLASPRPASR